MEQQLDWPVPYEKEKLTNLSKILSLLNNFERSKTEEDQISQLADDDNESDNAMEDVGLEVDEGSTEPDAKKMKVNSNSSVNQSLSLEELCDEFKKQLAANGNLNPVLADLDQHQDFKFKDFTECLTKGVAVDDFNRLIQCSKNFFIIEDQLFRLLLTLLALLVEEKDIKPCSAAEGVALLLSSYPQRKSILVTSVFNMHQGGDILDSILELNVLNKSELRDALLFSLQTKQLPANYFQILEKLMDHMYPDVLQDNELVMTVFSFLTDAPESAKCLKTAKFTVKILSRIDELDAAAFSSLQAFVMTNKTFLKRKMESLLKNFTDT